MVKKTCSIENCTGKYYAKGWCRSHYRKVTGEGKKYWQKLKADKDRHEKHLTRVSEYQKEYSKTEKYKSKRNEYLKKKYKDDPKYRARIVEWKKKQSIEKKRQWYKRDHATSQFGSYLLVKEIMEKYNNGCAECGMTNEESMEKWGSRLSLHHIDGNGRAKPRELKNNNKNNLIPLCKSCHQKIERSNLV